MNEQELRNTLLKVFKQEVNERLISMVNCLISIESKQGTEAASDLLKTIYREAHSIKGAARSIGLTSIEKLFQIIESAFFEIINGKLQDIPNLFDTLITICKELREITLSEGIESDENIPFIDNLTEKLSTLISDKLIVGEKSSAVSTSNLFSEETKNGKELPPDSTEHAIQQSVTTSDIETSSLHGPVSKPLPDTNAGQAPSSQKKETSTSKIEKTSLPENTDFSTVRIDSAKLDRLLRNSENLIVIKQFFTHKYPIISDLASETGISAKKIDKLITELNLLSYHEFCFDSTTSGNPLRSKLSEISSSLNLLKVKIAETHKKALNLLAAEKEDHRYTSNLIDEFLNGLKEIAMVPISNITGILPIMAREMAQKLEKKISLEISGDSMMLDRRILDTIKDPLMHLVRNSIDHGIETPSQRKKLGKADAGIIRISITSSDSNYLEINISDDGSGVNINKLKRKIIEKNLAKEDEVAAMSEERLISFIFSHGFSTSDIITDLSGRGLGLSIVKENVELIGGTVSIINSEGKGAAFSLRLPITMATYKGIIIKDATCLFILPSVGTEIITRVQSKDVTSIENRWAIPYENRILPLISLAHILGLKPSFNPKDKKNISTAILGKGTEQLALLIEEVLEEREIIIRDLGRNITKVPFISGVTVFSSGEIVPILNISDIIKFSSSCYSSDAPSGPSKGLDSSGKKKKRRILLAEDSPTSRTLIKNILEAAGFEVIATNDGQEAFTYMQNNKIDLLVSDIEMPRMDGFELTRKARNNDKFKELPVILVTSLSSREDMERGIEAGANSYIIKSQFDQSVLINTVKSLI